jgi:hypothetical protein
VRKGLTFNDVPKLIALGLYVALLACSSPETLARPPVTATIDARTLTVPPPPAIPPRVWSARLFTYGGYTSGGKGMIAMRSDGKVEAIWHCNAQLSEGKRRAVEDAVSSARPESWKTGYLLPQPSGLTDQFSYSFSLSVGEVAGKEVTYPVSWTSESFGLLPDDLRRLHDALWAAREELSEKCR